MKIIRAKDYADMSRKAANIISAQVIMKPDCVLGLATGGTPVGTYAQLVDWYNKGDIDFSEPSSTRISSKSVKVWARMEEMQALRKRSVLYTGTMMLISGCFLCCSCTINSSLLQVVFCRLSALLRHRSR